MSASEIFINSLNQKFDNKGLKLIQRFFFTFSRFECALKQSIEFAKTAQHGGVEADWEKFIKNVKPVFDKNRSLALQEAVDFLLKNPPKKQVIHDNKIVFVDINTKGKSEIDCLKLYIKTIRNNLFHGGKFYGRMHPEDSRNYKLLLNGIIVMDELISLNKSVNKNFLAPIP